MIIFSSAFSVTASETLGLFLTYGRRARYWTSIGCGRGYPCFTEKRLQRGKQAHKQRHLQKTRKQIHQSSSMAKPKTQDSTQWSQVGNLSTKSGGGRGGGRWNSKLALSKTLYLPHRRSGTLTELQWQLLLVKKKARWSAMLLMATCFPTPLPTPQPLPGGHGAPLSCPSPRTFSSLPTKHTGLSMNCVSMLALTRALGSSITSTMIVPPTLGASETAELGLTPSRPPRQLT